MKEYLSLFLISLAIYKVYGYPDGYDNPRPPPRPGPGPGRPPPPKPGMFDGRDGPPPHEQGGDETGMFSDDDEGAYGNPQGTHGDSEYYSYENMPTERPILNGDLGSVCTRGVRQTVHRVTLEHSTCWEEEQVPCYICGNTCRIYGNTCFRQTRQTCPRHKQSFPQQTVDHLYCCPGYEQVDDTCQPVRSSSPCGQNNGGCEQLCVNMGAGRKRCECFNGYRLVDGSECEDINECAAFNGGCNNRCLNTPGSFVCTCAAGYSLRDPHTCQDVNECSVNNGGCAHTCMNTRGSFYCQCDPGFRRVRDFECHAVNQCNLYRPCSHTCVSLPNTYACGCPQGQRLDGPYGRNCIGSKDVAATPEPKKDGYLSKGKTSADPNVGNPPVDRQMALILGAVFGGLFLVFCITIVICLSRRSQAASASAGGNPGPTSSTNLNAQYESTVHYNSQGSRPPNYHNNAYDGLIPLSKTLGPVPPPPKGAVENDYLEVLPPPPPYSVAPPVPKEVYMTSASGSQCTDSAIYETLDYGTASSVKCDDKSPPLPPSPRPNGTGGTSRVSPTVPDRKNTALPPPSDQELDAARNNLKKHTEK